MAKSQHVMEPFELRREKLGTRDFIRMVHHSNFAIFDDGYM